MPCKAGVLRDLESRSEDRSVRSGRSWCQLPLATGRFAPRPASADPAGAGPASGISKADPMCGGATSISLAALCSARAAPGDDGPSDGLCTCLAFSSSSWCCRTASAWLVSTSSSSMALRRSAIALARSHFVKRCPDGPPHTSELSFGTACSLSEDMTASSSISPNASMVTVGSHDMADCSSMPSATCAAAASPKAMVEATRQQRALFVRSRRNRRPNTRHAPSSCTLNWSNTAKASWSRSVRVTRG
mmetsp:Transcript_8031/g.31667  ORF Transcript_8031/g.31667 Transcript_8031/m.31667 type:complete len:247 (+) Transcript_8031:1339-2079(+)